MARESADAGWEFVDRWFDIATVRAVPVVAPISLMDRLTASPAGGRPGTVLIRGCHIEAG